MRIFEVLGETFMDSLGDDWMILLGVVTNLAICIGAFISLLSGPTLINSDYIFTGFNILFLIRFLYVLYNKLLTD